MGFDAKKESEMFDKAAEYYDKFRPGYPKEIIETMIEKTKLSCNSKTLEIGAGSGKATEYFKDYGFSIRCIEPGENLVKNGQIKYKEYSNINFECGRGNRFLELSDEVKEIARKEIEEHAKKFGGKIVRTYLCVLYLARKK